MPFCFPGEVGTESSPQLDSGSTSACELPPTKMMEEMNVATDESYDSLDEHYDRPAERWAPLGAAVTTPVPGPMEEAEWR